MEEYYETFSKLSDHQWNVITEKNGAPLGIEIKASTKINSGMLKGLNFWQKNQPLGSAILIHGGAANETVNERISIVPWTEIINF